MALSAPLCYIFQTTEKKKRVKSNMQQTWFPSGGVPRSDLMPPMGDPPKPPSLLGGMINGFKPEAGRGLVSGVWLAIICFTVSLKSVIILKIIRKVQ